MSGSVQSHYCIIVSHMQRVRLPLGTTYALLTRHSMFEMDIMMDRFTTSHEEYLRS